MTQPTEEPIGYDGFGAPIYEWQDVGWIDPVDVETAQEVADHELTRWRTTSREKFIIQVVDFDPAFLYLLFGFDPRPCLAEQAIPAKGQE